MLLSWFARYRDWAWMFALAMLAYVATHPAPESQAALIKIDDRDFLHCPESGCWWKVRSEMSWADLAQRIKADAAQLRADNPQVSGDVLEAGQLIRLRERAQAAQ